MKNSKHGKIRKHLLLGRKITGTTALIRFNVYRLSSVIHRLRREGLNIKTVMGELNGETYAVYFIPLEKAK